MTIKKANSCRGPPSALCFPFVQEPLAQNHKQHLRGLAALELCNKLLHNFADHL